jgi:hypothetical protein
MEGQISASEAAQILREKDILIAQKEELLGKMMNEYF